MTNREKAVRISEKLVHIYMRGKGEGLVREMADLIEAELNAGENEEQKHAYFWPQQEPGVDY